MKIQDFVKGMKEKATRGLLDVSHGGKSSEQTYKFQIGQATVTTIEGGAIEKASITHMILKDIIVPGTNKKVDGTIYQMEVFPENPYCPMGHFNTDWTTSGQINYYMNLDLFPAVRVEEDLNTMRSLMDGVADKFGKDRDKIREGLDTHYNMPHWPFPLVTKVGCTLPKQEEGDLNLYITAYHTFFDAYLDILSKRKDTQFGEKERRLKLKRNGQWLEYLTLQDRAVKMAQATGVPPEVLIGLGFPPSAIF